ncbi:MAG: hypothetical protein ACBZ72_01580 [Candidatus Bathyarchaeia archaeon]
MSQKQGQNHRHTGDGYGYVDGFLFPEALRFRCLFANLILTAMWLHDS